MIKLTPLKAIRLKCKEDCCCGDKDNWINCEAKNCPIWPYRFGKIPKSEVKSIASGKNTPEKRGVLPMKNGSELIVEPKSAFRQEVLK